MSKALDQFNNILRSHTVDNLKLIALRATAEDNDDARIVLGGVLVELERRMSPADFNQFRADVTGE